MEHRVTLSWCRYWTKGAWLTLPPVPDGGVNLVSGKRLSARQGAPGVAAAGVPVNRAAQLLGGQPSAFAEDGHPQIAGRWWAAGPAEQPEPQLFGHPFTTGPVDQHLQVLGPAGGDVPPAVPALSVRVDHGLSLIHIS